MVFSNLPICPLQHKGALLGDTTTPGQEGAASKDGIRGERVCVLRVSRVWCVLTWFSRHLLLEVSPEGKGEGNGRGKKGLCGILPSPISALATKDKPHLQTGEDGVSSENGSASDGGGRGRGRGGGGGGGGSRGGWRRGKHSPQDPGREEKVEDEKERQDHLSFGGGQSRESLQTNPTMPSELRRGPLSVFSREGGRETSRVIGTLHTLRTANMYMDSRLSLWPMKLKVCAEPMSADDVVAIAPHRRRRPGMGTVHPPSGEKTKTQTVRPSPAHCSLGVSERWGKRGEEGRAMYSRGWPKSTAVGERMSKEGKDDDHKKSVLPPLPPGSGGGVGSGLVASGLSRLTNVGGEIRSPSHGGARARQAAQAQVAPQRPVPPIAVQGGVGGGGGRIPDASEANGRGMGSTSGRTSQSPRRSNSTGWIQPPPSGHRQPSPRGSVASPSRGRPVGAPYENNSTNAPQIFRASKHTNKQTNKQTNKHTHTHTHTYGARFRFL